MILLSKDELESILSDIGLEDFKEEVKLKNETRGRKPTDLFNHWYYAFRSVYEYDHLAAWVDDVLTGAARLDTGNSRVSSKMVFSLLRSLPFISTAEIKSYLNSSRMRILWGEEIESDRYCRWLRTAMLSAIRSLDYHTDKGREFRRYNEASERDFSFNLKEDIDGWKSQKETCAFYSVPVTTALYLPLILPPK